MGDLKRGDDAADHAPKPTGGGEPGGSAPPAEKQDAPNYEERADRGKAIEVENLSSANDEGAN